MYCPYCGAQNHNDARFCMYCGHSMMGNMFPNNNANANANNANNQPKADAPVADGKKKKRGSKKLFGFFMGVFLNLLGFIVGICMYDRGTEERRTFIKGWIWGVIIISVVESLVGYVYGPMLLELYAGYVEQVMGTGAEVMSAICL